MKLQTRAELSNVLLAQMSTRTIKSDYITGTIFEDWLVCYMCIAVDGVLEIECVPREYGLN